MSRKHFEMLALALIQTRPSDNPATTEYNVWRDVVGAVATACAAANDRFDVVRFNRAAGVIDA